MRFAMAVGQELVFLPEGGRLIEALHFVADARILELEFEHLVVVEQRWLKLNLARSFLFNFLKVDEGRRLMLPLHCEVAFQMPSVLDR